MFIYSYTKNKFWFLNKSPQQPGLLLLGKNGRWTKTKKNRHEKPPGLVSAGRRYSDLGNFLDVRTTLSLRKKIRVSYLIRNYKDRFCFLCCVYGLASLDREDNYEEKSSAKTRVFQPSAANSERRNKRISLGIQRDSGFFYENAILMHTFWTRKYTEAILGSKRILSL